MFDNHKLMQLAHTLATNFQEKHIDLASTMQSILTDIHITNTIYFVTEEVLSIY
jgi:hypothetical protein